ncbi:hypothetical protein IAT38_004712 [Cryptococcus sp. DSM 104549]
MDDLLDLNWSSSSQPPRPPSNSTSPKPPPTATTPSSFDFLSLSAQPSGPGKPNYYSSKPLRSSTPSLTPNPAPAPGLGTTLQPGGAQPGGAGAGAGRVPPRSNTSTPLPAPAPVPAPTSSGDAFSSLFSIAGSSGSSSGSKNMTMAEKQAALAEEKRRKAEEERKRFEAEGEFWENLGNGSGSVGDGAGQGKPAVKTGGEFDGLLRPTASTTASSSSKPSRPPSAAGILAPSPAPSKPSSSKGTFWDQFPSTGDTAGDDDDLLSGSGGVRLPASQPRSQAHSPAPPMAAPAPAAEGPSDPFDFDALESSMDRLTAPSRASHVATAGASRRGAPGNGDRNGNGYGSGMRTPVSDFDFGERREVGEEEEDDILGELGRPVVHQAKPTREEPTHRAPKSTAQRRSSSPPPHIVGQIVEMGFSPTQARQALAQTPTGLNVQAALELLLAAQGSGSGSGSNTRPGGEGAFPEDDDDLIAHERAQREAAERERRRRRRAGPSRDTVKARSAEEKERDRETTEAEKILAQASEIGQNMFSKATSFWNQGKEKALKAYEEQRRAYEANLAAGAGAGGGGEGERGERKVKDGRPRWMQEAEAAEAAEAHGWRDEKAEMRGGFKDSDDEEEGQRAGPSRSAGQDRPRRQQLPQADKGKRPANGGGSRQRTADDDLLAGDDQPARSGSSARPAPSSRPTPASRPPASRPPPKPSAPLITRTLIPATPSVLQTSAAHKTRGNAHFKLGRFSEADSAYSSAIASLPAGHLLLIPLYNNRAATRLKLGDSASAAADCSAVIDLVGLGYHPSKETPLPAELAEVRLGEGLGKAVLKRAQAWEMGEKWKSALEDWERVMGLDAAVLGVGAGSVKNLAVEGARRARKMIEGGDAPKPLAARPAPSAAPTAKRHSPAPAPPKSKPADVNRSAAVADLRRAAQQLEAEDDARLKHKDAVEAKLTAWKGGKETNLRALIASLDTVLWDEIMKGGLKVGMHELVTDKQVKIKYMKVIARLHPDKLNVGNTTVEQRMLANGAFGALSDAWQEFNK